MKAKVYQTVTYKQKTTKEVVVIGTASQSHMALEPPSFFMQLL